jgi:hypothetical protein
VEVEMKCRSSLALIVAGLASMYTLVAAQQPAKPQIQVPQSGVPQIMTLEGEFNRVAYNNEGYVGLAYRLANQSVGGEWMLLDVGATMRDGKPNYKLERSHISLETPDGQTILLPSNKEYLEGDLRALENRARVTRDSVNYFPPGATTPCRIGFFAPIESRAMAHDEVELSWQRACVGRLYFKVPGGIKHGQYWLNVKFADSLIRVPFRILTDDERKLLSKNYKDIKKQVEDAFKKKGS